MRSLQHYIEMEARCVDDVIEAKSIYQAKIANPDLSEEDKREWQGRLDYANMRLRLARLQIKSYLETHILSI